MTEFSGPLIYSGVRYRGTIECDDGTREDEGHQRRHTRVLPDSLCLCRPGSPVVCPTQPLRGHWHGNHHCGRHLEYRELPNPTYSPTRADYGSCTVPLQRSRQSPKWSSHCLRGERTWMVLCRTSRAAVSLQCAPLQGRRARCEELGCISICSACQSETLPPLCGLYGGDNHTEMRAVDELGVLR